MRIEPLSEARKDELGELLTPLAAQWVVGLRELDTRALNRILAQIPEDGEAVFLMLLGALVNPETPIKTALSWTDSMVDPRGRRRREPRAERERQRLIAGGVPADTAIVLAAREVEQEQHTTQARMLRVIHGERTA